MTRLPAANMVRKPTSVVAVRKIGAGAGAGGWRYVVASAGNGVGGAVRVTESGVLPSVEAVVQKAGGSKGGSVPTGALVQVLPADAVTVRPVRAAVSLDGPPEQITAALNLVAEAELPSTVPEHRRCAGVLRVGASKGIVGLCWVNDTETIKGAACVPVPVALAHLHRLTGAGSGVAVHAERDCGSVVLVGVEDKADAPVYCRVLRDDPDDDVSWEQVVDESVVDAMDELKCAAPLAAGVSLRLPKMPLSAFGISAPSTSAALEDFGLLIGAASAALSGRPDEQPLLSMSAESPIVSRPIWTRVFEGLSSPRALVTTGVVCVCMLLAGWVLAAPLHLAILKSRTGLTGEADDFTKVAEQNEWYRTLRDKRLPLTAVMAELTAQAPTGVNIESMTLEVGRPISVGGTAPDAETLNQWRTKLNSNGAFEEFQWNSPEESSNPVRFTLTGKLNEPLLAGGAELKAVPSTATPVEGSSRPSDEPRTGSNGNNRNNRGNRNATPTPSGQPGAASANKVELPKPLSDAEINGLASGKLMIEWAKRKGRLDDQSIDATVRERLRAEWEKLDRRKNELQGGNK